MRNLRTIAVAVALIATITACSSAAPPTDNSVPSPLQGNVASPPPQSTAVPSITTSNKPSGDTVRWTCAALGLLVVDPIRDNRYGRLAFVGTKDHSYPGEGEICNGMHVSLPPLASCASREGLSRGRGCNPPIWICGHRSEQVIHCHPYRTEGAAEEQRNW